MWINFVCLLVLICGFMSKLSTFPSSSRFTERVVVRCARASGWRCSCWNTNWHWQWKMFKNVNVNDVPGRLSANLQPNQKVVWVPHPKVFRFYFRDPRLFIKSSALQMSTRVKRNLSKMSYCKTLNNCQQKIIRKLPLNIFAEVKPIMMSTKFGTAVQFSVKLCCDF